MVKNVLQIHIRNLPTIMVILIYVNKVTKGHQSAPAWFKGKELTHKLRSQILPHFSQLRGWEMVFVRGGQKAQEVIF